MPGHSQEDVIKFVEMFFDEIAKTLAANKKIELRNFGVLYVARYGKRRLTDPRNGKLIESLSSYVPKFKFSSTLMRKN